MGQSSGLLLPGTSRTLIAGASGRCRVFGAPNRLPQTGSASRGLCQDNSRAFQGTADSGPVPASPTGQRQSEALTQTGQDDIHLSTADRAQGRPTAEIDVEQFLLFFIGPPPGHYLPHHDHSWSVLKSMLSGESPVLAVTRPPGLCESASRAALANTLGHADHQLNQVDKIRVSRDLRVNQPATCQRSGANRLADPSGCATGVDKNPSRASGRI